MKIVLFDYGNVISLPQAEADVARLATLLGGPETEGPPGFEERYWAARLDFDRATLDPGAYWSFVYGRPVTGGELDQAVALDAASWSRPNEDTAAVIEELAGQGVPMALLSNAPICIADGIDPLPFLAPIGPRFYSGRMGMVKPDAEIYLKVIEELGVPAGDVVFVDDRTENVAAAQAVGVHGVHFRDGQTLREELKPLLA
ncbi:HAD family hydrolase [Sphaerimonospora thailandensis]|uniref:Haloacid dehalogenase n=1 Tax=Sphaerimonospora thailandensis TaxID=795644 RepID=A0A8J3R5Y8_9ACTN|nr:HAD family phosphatase [Sphaerimonospora thailandensis]GIH68400.1 haloacid dehalogenase [Sphaerimonospora thailandensis]